MRPTFMKTAVIGLLAAMAMQKGHVALGEKLYNDYRGTSERKPRPARQSYGGNHQHNAHYPKYGGDKEIARRALKQKVVSV